MCDGESGRDLFTDITEMFCNSEVDVEGKITCAKAGISYFSELIRVAYGEGGQEIIDNAASGEFMAKIEAMKKAGIN